MISSSHLNKLIYFTFFIFILILNSSSCLATEDIWKNKDKKKDQSIKADEENKITIENSILSEDINKITVKIDENKIEDSQESVMGIFDPEENNFNLNMWFHSDGNDIKKVLKRINKLKLSKTSEELLFQILFTNAYSPKINLNSLNSIYYSNNLKKLLSSIIILFFILFFLFLQ